MFTGLHIFCLQPYIIEMYDEKDIFMHEPKNNSYKTKPNRGAHAFPTLDNIPRDLGQTV